MIGSYGGCDRCYGMCRYRRDGEFAHTPVRDPIFSKSKLGVFDRPEGRNLILTGMSDFAFWLPGWRRSVFSRMAGNPQHNYIMMTKSPGSVTFGTDMECAWFGTTVTRSCEASRIDDLRRNLRSPHRILHVEPAEGGLGSLDVGAADWVVIGVDITAGLPERGWVDEVSDAARDAGVPVYMKSGLEPVMGDGMVRRFPPGMLCRE